MSLLDPHRIARQGDAAFHIVFQQMHREAVVAMRIGIVKHKYIVALHFPQSRQAVNLYFLFFRRLPEVENSGSHNGFVYQNVVTRQQGGLHGIGRYTEGSKGRGLQQESDYYQNSYPSQ